MPQGWISVHRQLQNHWLWEEKPFSKGQAWIDILMLASHEDKKILLGCELVDIEAGSFVTSEIKLAERWGWSKTKTRAFLDLLAQDKMIVKKADRKKTTIFVINYSNFQLCETTEEPQKNQKKTTKRPQKNTINNDNNENNENNIFIKDIREKTKFSPPTVEEVRAYCLERKNDVDAEHFVDYYGSQKWKKANGRPVEDWKACVRTWEKKNGYSAPAKKQKESISESFEKLQHRAMPTQEEMEYFKRKAAEGR